MLPGQEVSPVLSQPGVFCILLYLHCILHSEQELLSWQECSSGIHLPSTHLQSCSPEALSPGLSDNKWQAIFLLYYGTVVSRSHGDDKSLLLTLRTGQQQQGVEGILLPQAPCPWGRRLGQPTLVSKDNLNGSPVSCYRPHLPHQAMGLTQAPNVPSAQLPPHP